MAKVKRAGDSVDDRDTILVIEFTFEGEDPLWPRDGRSPRGAWLSKEKKHVWNRWLHRAA
jgi:hypothetical protein